MCLCKYDPIDLSKKYYFLWKNRQNKIRKVCFCLFSDLRFLLAVSPPYIQLIKYMKSFLKAGSYWITINQKKIMIKKWLKISVISNSSSFVPFKVSNQYVYSIMILINFAKLTPTSHIVYQIITCSRTIILKTR